MVAALNADTIFLKLGDQSILGGGILIVDDELQCRAPFVAVNHLLSEIETATIDEARALLEYEKVVARAPEKRVRPASIDDERVLTVTAKDAPLGRAIEQFGTVVAIPVLCGLHHRYARI